MNIHWKNWCWSWSSSTLATWCKELTHLKRPWCWERLKAGGEWHDRGWHHRLDGHEFEQALGVGDRQGSLACCSPRGCKELDMTEWLNWTEQTHTSFWFVCFFFWMFHCRTQVLLSTPLLLCLLCLEQLLVHSRHCINMCWLDEC